MAIKETTVVKQKPYFLSDEERLDVGSQIASALDETDELQREKESFNATHKAKEKDLTLRMDKLRRLHRDGFELRDYKCNVLRNIAEKKVDFVVADGDDAGKIIDSRPFNQDDWNAILEDSQLDMFNGVSNPDAPDENDLRAKADLTTEPEIQPDMENGKVIAGPNTDAYNMKHKDSPYQHLSEPVDFQPAQLSNDAAEPTDAADVDRSEAPTNTGATKADIRADAADMLGDNSDGDDSDEDEGDDNGDDEPQPDKPAPNPPKRKARRKGDPKE